MYIMALYATFGIGASLAKSYNLDQVSGGILATIAFLLTLVPVAIPEEASKAAGVSGFVLPMANLGGAGCNMNGISAVVRTILLRVYLVNVFTRKPIQWWNAFWQQHSRH